MGALLATLVVVGLGLLVGNDWAPLLELDLRIDSALHDAAESVTWLQSLAWWLGVVGGGPVSSVLSVAVVLVLLVGRRWRTALAVAVISACAPWLTGRIKVVVGRGRPVWADPFETLYDPSFPSGHATGGIAVWCVCGIALASLVRDRKWALIVAISFIVVGVAIGLSRMVLGVHWPSDVVAGWCVALAVTGVVSALVLPGRAEPDPP